MDVLRFFAFKRPIRVKEVNPAEVELIVVAAQESMVHNITIVRQIADVTVQDLNVFWRSVKLYEFSDPIFTSMLKCLSSMDSSRIYISRELITGSDQLACQRALEYEYANALSRWGKPNPCLSSACIDCNLRAAHCQDAVVGAGDFYEERVHEKRAVIPTPFDLKCHAVRRE